MNEFIRQCPWCNKEIKYINKLSLLIANKKGTLCRCCRSKGSKNNFYRHTHSEASKEKMRNRNRDKSFFNTQAYRDKVSKNSKGEKNGMYGRTYYQIWVQKYGKEKADQLQEEKSIKISKRTTGKNNPMFGRTAPQGSGNGWKGWYKNWFFRSLKELSYVIKILEKEKHFWTSAENIKIPYIGYNDQQRTYAPDFLVDLKILVEIKPKKLHNSLSVKLKQQAAEKYASEHGLTYKLIDPVNLSKDEIKELHDSGTIIFTEKYEEKFKCFNLEERF